MTQYNVALRVGYNGTAVSKGAARNAKDIGALSAATRSQGNASQIAARQNTTLASSFSMMAGAVSLYAAVGFGRQIISDTTASELLTTRILNLSGSSEKAAANQEYLVATAGKLNARYKTLADSYSRLIVLENQKTLSQEESRAVLEGMINVSKTLGATNAQVGQAMYGLTQALTQGRVQAQELNQVIEPLPGLLQALDKASGQVTGGFRKMVVDGKVTSQFLKETLIKAFKDYEGAATSTADTIAAANANLGTQYDQLIQKLESPINSAITPVINAIASSVQLLGDNVDVLDDVAFAAGALATVFGARLVGAIGSATAATISKIAANTAALASEKASAASNLAVAKSELQKAISIQAGNERQLIAANTDYARSAALNNLARSNGIVTAAQNAHTLATTRYVTAGVAASATARTVGASMALLGGPLGVITIGAIALGYFATSASNAKGPTDDLTESTRKLNEEQSKLNPFKNYTKSQTTSALARYEAMLETQVQLAEEARFRASNSNSKVDVFQLDEANRRVDEITQKIQFAQAQLKKFEPAEVAEVVNGNDNNQGVIQPPKLDYSAQLEQLRFNLLSEENQITASYKKRQAILDGSLAQKLISDTTYQTLSNQLMQQKDQEIVDYKAEKEQERLDLAKARRDEELRLLEQSYEEQIRQLEGFASRKEQIEFQLEERLFAFKTRKTGEMQGTLQNFSNFEKKDALERTNAVVSLGEFGFKQMAGQSKKAFAMYKAFSIAKAVMNTYEMATGAFNALAPIPVVGPALGAAAAAAAVAFGLGQVNTIKNQQYSAAYHGGRDYIPSEQTALLQQGERVVSPRQNVALTRAVDVINSGGSNGQIVVHYAPVITVEGNDNDAFNNANQLEKEMYQRFESRLISQLRNRTGAVYNAVRNAA